jgi:adenylosuccinate synthase
MQRVVIISGKTFTGKSSLADGLESQFNYLTFHTSDFLKALAKERGLATDRLELQELGDSLDIETCHSWVFREVFKLSMAHPKRPIVVDNLRNAEQLEYFRTHHDWKLTHVHLYAPSDVLQDRFNFLISNNEAVNVDFDAWNLLKKEDDVISFKNDADVRINTDRSDSADTLVRVAARLNLYSSPDVKCVDVIVGGQFGSEGKGNIAAYLASEYDVLIRVGGPNAGHTVSSASGIYTYHQLPSGTRDTQAEILLGPGMTINVQKLLTEIKDCRITPERLFIDPQAMIIESRDIRKEKGLVANIGSTGQGGGAAAARRILGRTKGEVKLAKNIPALAPYVGDKEPYRGCTSSRLELAYSKGLSILLEGTQGSGLSLYHGSYPHVTSRDTNVAGCLAEAGISPSRIRRIVMVVRSTPIRVGHPNKISLLTKLKNQVGSMLGTDDTSNTGDSGPLKHEIDFDLVAKLAGLDKDELRQNEKTSTTKRDRRVGWFDWELFRKSCSLNAPTDIVLTFADYIKADNEKAHRFEQLTEDSIKFIEELERVAQAPVSLISTRFPREGERIDLRNIIDRRNWATRNKIS